MLSRFSGRARRALAAMKAWAAPPNGMKTRFIEPTGPVFCRGFKRAAERRNDAEALARWRRANQIAAPFRARIVASIERAKKLLEEQRRASA